MATTEVYGSGLIKPRRKRRTRDELAELKGQIYDIAEENQPCSSRQIYYVGAGVLWEKDQDQSRRNYQMVNRHVGQMRENDELPWEWITDSTRLCRIPAMYDSIEEAFAEWRSQYRRNLWTRQARHVEVWCESDSIGAVLHPVTRKLGIGLFSCRGQSGKGFIYESVQQWAHNDKPVTVLYIGDWDPSGMAIPKSVHERQIRYSRQPVELDFRRIAVTPEDVASGMLTSHSTNKKDKNYRRFVEECRRLDLDPAQSIEVEAIRAPVLRDLLETEIYDLVEDIESWNSTIQAEASEDEIMRRLTSREFVDLARNGAAS